MEKCKRINASTKSKCLSFLAGAILFLLPTLALAQSEGGGLVLVQRKVEISNNGHYEYGREGISRETIDLTEGLFHQKFWKKDGQGRMLLEIESTITFVVPPLVLRPGQKLVLNANGTMTVRNDNDTKPLNIVASLSYEMTRNYGIGFTGQRRIALERYGPRKQKISPWTTIDRSAKGGIQIAVNCSRGLSIVWTYTLEREADIPRILRIKELLREFKTRTGPAVAQVMEVSGNVEILTGRGGWRHIKQGEKIMRGDKIRTGSFGRIRVNCNPPGDYSEPKSRVSPILVRTVKFPLLSW
jgi:hypothetical protein